MLYYTHQCPFTAKYVPILKQYADKKGIPFEVIHITDRKTAQNAPTPVTNYALFKDGKYLTNEVQNVNKFEKLRNG